MRLRILRAFFAGTAAYAAAALFLSTGCASLMMTRAKISYEDTGKIFSLAESPPTEEESRGILLKFHIPKSGALEYRETTRIFSRIEGDEGLKLDAGRIIFQKFRKLAGGDSWIVITESRLKEDGKSKSYEEVKTDSSGSIALFVRGEFETEGGKLRILDWSRTPLFPDKPVKVGDEWRYAEKMKVELDSFWVTRKSDEPFTANAVSRLDGFAVVNGRRCAVITSRASQKRKEIFKVLFKTVYFDIHSYVTEKAFFDWKEGVIVGKTVKTESFSLSPDSSMNDMSQSMTTTVLLEKKK